VCVRACACTAVPKRPSTPTPPPAQTITKPALKEEDVEKKSTAIIEEYLQINDMKVHTHTQTHTCVQCDQTDSLKMSRARKLICNLPVVPLVVPLRANRRRCSVCRRCPATSCSLCLCGSGWSRRWCAAQSSGSTWVCCCTRWSRTPPYPPSSTTKGNFTLVPPSHCFSYTQASHWRK